MEVVASLSQGRTAAAQCGLFTYKSVPVIFEPPCKMNAKCEVLVFFSFIVPSKLAALMTAFIFLNKLISESTNEVTICEYKFRAVARTDSTNVTGNTLLFLILPRRTV